MVSTGYYGLSRSEALAEELRGYEIVRGPAWRGNVAYAAVRSPKGYVFAVIAKATRYRDETVIKTMDESVQPYYYDCPATVFAALTPIEEIAAITNTDQAFARVWREQVAENLAKAKAAKAVKRGDTVRFASVLRFPGFIGEHTDLIFEKGNLFRTTDGFRVRVPGWRTREWEVAA